MDEGKHAGKQKKPPELSGGSWVSDGIRTHDLLGHNQMP